MAKKKAAECPAGERWAVPYADFLSLLLALFIALWAISNTDASKAKAMSDAMINVFNVPRPSVTFQPLIQRPPDPGQVRESTEGKMPHTSDGSSPSFASQSSISQMQMVIQEGGVLEQIEQGIVLRLPVSLPFEQGKADISHNENALSVRRIAEVLNKLPEEVKIDVRGYTDDKPLPKGSPFKDNYDLAAARARVVTEGLFKNGATHSNISYSAHGSSSPTAPNTTAQNQQNNNRVEIFIFTQPTGLRSIKSVLDESMSGTTLEDGTPLN